MIRLLETKGLLRHRKAGTKYIYRPTQSKQTASKKALNHLVKTFLVVHHQTPSPLFSTPKSLPRAISTESRR